MKSDKGWTGHFFEDFEVGSSMQCPTPRTITAGDVSNYIAFTGDRTPRFCGPAGLVHPLITFHQVMGQTVRQISLNARANLGYADMRWKAPVYVGDTVATRVDIAGLKENSSGETGIAWVQTTGMNQNGDEVLTYTRWVMVKKRGSGPTPYRERPVIPELPTAVRPSDLRPHVDPLPRAAETLGRYAFEDYSVGERVFHYDGMTVNRSDHMSFTRLFQNSAKVHFDELLTDGRPLVYGGLPISMGYAQALNGLENRLGICAINGGSHTAPLYAGDTLYSFTDVLETADLGDASPVGALRCRLICVKNEDPSSGEWLPEYPIRVDDPNRPGRKRYHAAVVLYLDFWELVVKRAAL